MILSTRSLPSGFIDFLFLKRGRERKKGTDGGGGRRKRNLGPWKRGPCCKESAILTIDFTMMRMRIENRYLGVIQVSVSEPVPRYLRSPGAVRVAPFWLFLDPCRIGKGRKEGEGEEVKKRTKPRACLTPGGWRFFVPSYQSVYSNSTGRRSNACEGSVAGCRSLWDVEKPIERSCLQYPHINREYFN